MNVGILAMQGDVPEHRAAVTRLGGEYVPMLVQGPADLPPIHALLMPGGESTTMGKLLREGRLWEPLSARLAEGLPVLGTCAGLILLARELTPGEGGEAPPTFAQLDITVRRNDYGRQRDSFEAPVQVEGLRGGPFPGVFIRAPRIVRLGPTVRPIARRDNEVVGVRAGPAWGLAFHPELSGDDRILRGFLASARSVQTNRTRKTASSVRARPMSARVR